MSIRGFGEATRDERAALAKTLDDALATTGICHINQYQQHLPDATIRALRHAAAHFFDQKKAAKETARVDGVVGYLGLGDENVAASVGNPTPTPDPVESLNLPGYQEADGEWRAAAAAAECPWRAKPWVPTAHGLRDALIAYWAGVTEIMLVLMEMAEVALELPRGHFKDAFARPGTLLRLAWYPSTNSGGDGGAAEEPQLRYGAHTDFDGFTILQRALVDGGDGVDGLEYETREGRWVPVPSLPDTLTINIGDLLARWTNDRWRATRHRVVRPPAGEREGAGRLSIVYFTGPHPETVVRCVPSPKCDAGRPKYEPITAAAHVEAKMRAATAEARGEALLCSSSYCTAGAQV